MILVMPFLNLYNNNEIINFVIAGKRLPITGSVEGKDLCYTKGKNFCQS